MYIYVCIYHIICICITNFLYGLQAAINFTWSLIFLPLIRLSHMISLISPIFSVVLVSSKNNMV